MKRETQNFVITGKTRVTRDRAGQTLQAELLVVYGADPGSPDVNGRTPIDYAR